MNELEPVTAAPKTVVQPPVPLSRTAVPTRFTSIQTGLKTVLVRTGPMLVYRLNRIGRTGAAGAAMMLFALIFLVSAMLPQQRDLGELERQLQAAHDPQGGHEAAPVRLNRFMNTLPRRSDLPTIVGQVFKLAAAAPVTLDRGRYVLTPMRAGNLAQYRMTFPIKGRYPEIRLFIDSVMTTIPSATLDGLRMERKAVGEATVSADLRLVVFVRNDR